jgi:hypothetical protein
MHCAKRPKVNAMLVLALFAVILLLIAALYVHDRHRLAHAILRNYPIIGYFCYFARSRATTCDSITICPDWSKRPVDRLERAPGLSFG